jgi:hypothetical protein
MAAVPERRAKTNAGLVNRCRCCRRSEFIAWSDWQFRHLAIAETHGGRPWYLLVEAQGVE